jgi:PncC family amidohydrolase
VTRRVSARVGGMLRASGKTVAVAESCTGGLLAGAITEVPGASEYFLGGVVAYHNGAKTALLGVPAKVLRAKGAVSRETALAMAEGALGRFGADVAVAVTGVAGPGGGTRARPVGTVWVAVASRDGVRSSNRFRFPGVRAEVRLATVRAALAELARALSGKLELAGELQQNVENANKEQEKPV